MGRKYQQMLRFEHKHGPQESIDWLDIGLADHAGHRLIYLTLCRMILFSVLFLSLRY
jgi:hypothetical protein